MMYKKLLVCFSLILCWACSQEASGPTVEEYSDEDNSSHKSGNLTSSDSKSTVSSSSEAKSSSSSETENSSSSQAKSSSSNNEFDWSLPKTAYLNPDIEYGEITDERDGKKYKTVKIGDQTWMAENLNYADTNLTPSIKGNNWCIDNDEAKCDIVGRFYTWAAAIDSVALANDEENPRTCGYGASCILSDDTIRGICPEGWHLPSFDEWWDLHDAVGEDVAGKVLKSSKGWLGIHTGTDDYGFSVIPAGFPLLDENAKGKGQGERAFFICTDEWDEGSTETVFDAAYVMENDAGHLGANSKKGSFSIRCIKDM